MLGTLAKSRCSDAGNGSKGRSPKWLIEAVRWSLLAVGIVGSAHVSLAAQVLPQPETLFGGKIAINAKDSTPDWPQPITAPKGAPNIVLILLDDIGFADTSTFGGVAQTPELDKLAAQGLRYDNFNTTSMCSPTRAALLTGRNHHRVGFGIIADDSVGYPGYNSVWKKSTASVAEVLRLNGYSTAAFGKWHNTPDWEISPLGPFDRWPTGLGFEHFYGFMGPAGLENQWEPSRLYRDITPVNPPATPAQGYHLTTDITNQAISWLQAHLSLAPEKPYFLYFATGAVHAPHQAPREWIDKYRGQFDAGWDKVREQIFARQKQLGVIPPTAELTPRPQAIPAWDSLSADQKKLYARQMEVYAGFVAHTDHEVGRLLKAVQQGPGANNTLILYIVGDNGPEGGGGVDGFTSAGWTVADQLKHVDELGSPLVTLNIYSAGWAWVGATPFKWWKTIASHFGGVRDPLIISWPARIRDRGGLRGQFTHVNDVAATLYEATGISLPSVVDGAKQQPLDGVSFAYTFDHTDVPSKHHIQYFEMLGNRAMYQDGWIAAARHSVPWERKSNSDYTHDQWELYRVDQDFSEAHDLAAQYPSKLNTLQRLFEVEARKNSVYPLGGEDSLGKPSLTESQREFVYYPGTPRIPVALMPPLVDKSYRITANVVIPDTGAEGIIVSYGERTNGFALYIQGDRFIYEESSYKNHEVISSNLPVPRGEVTLTYEFNQKSVHKDENGFEDSRFGTGRLFINGQLVGQATLTQGWGNRYGNGYSGSLGIGQAFGSPVSDAFQLPFKLRGTLTKVEVNLQ
jgi:arylsulfatase A-like enzyme